MHIIVYYKSFLCTFIFLRHGKKVVLIRRADYLMFDFFERSENRWVLMLDQAAPGGLIKYNPHSYVARLLPPVKRAIFFTKTASTDELISALSVRSQTRWISLNVKNILIKISCNILHSHVWITFPLFASSFVISRMYDFNYLDIR